MGMWSTLKYSNTLLVSACNNNKYNHINGLVWEGRLIRRRSKKTSKLRVIGLCVPVTGEFLAQRASNAENLSIWWRHHDNEIFLPVLYNTEMHRSSHSKVSTDVMIWRHQCIPLPFILVNYASPVYGVATICHQVRWLRWGHPSLFHTATSLLIWYKMFCVRDISYRLIWMEHIHMFSVYAQSGTHSRFNW